MDVITITLSFESKLMYLPLIRGVTREICSSAISKETIFQAIDLSLNEALTNVIHHAYLGKSNREIHLTITLHPEIVIFQIIDQGIKNPYINEFSIPDHDLADENLKSGRGLYIIHKLMDEVYYFQDDDKNILLLHKYIN